MRQLSGFRIMWLQVIFDLPVTSPQQRKLAADFRNHLLDLGFEMEQFSVYFRFCADKTFADKIVKQVETEIPPEGSVKMLTFTDKQYESIRSFTGPMRDAPKKNPGQLALF